MAAIGGKAGACAVDPAANNAFIHFNSWTVNYSQAAVDVTAFAAVTRAKVAGIYEWSFSAEGHLDGTTCPDMTSAAVSATFTAAASRTYTGNVILTGMTPTVTIDGNATITVTGEGAGALTPA